MMTYSDKLRDPRWQRKRLEVLQRYDFKCRDCGASEKELHVHHCSYGDGEPWDIHPNFLIPLCAECHKYRQDFEKAVRFNIGLLFALSEPEEIADPFIWLVAIARSRVRIAKRKRWRCATSEVTP